MPGSGPHTQQHDATLALIQFVLPLGRGGFTKSIVQTTKHVNASLLGIDILSDTLLFPGVSCRLESGENRIFMVFKCDHFGERPMAWVRSFALQIIASMVPLTFPVVPFIQWRIGIPLEAAFVLFPEGA